MSNVNSRAVAKAQWSVWPAASGPLPGLARHEPNIVGAMFCTAHRASVPRGDPSCPTWPMRLALGAWHAARTISASRSSPDAGSPVHRPGMRPAVSSTYFVCDARCPSRAATSRRNRCVVRGVRRVNPRTTRPRNAPNADRAPTLLSSIASLHRDDVDLCRTVAFVTDIVRSESR